MYCLYLYTMICVLHMACVRMFFWGYDFIVCCRSRVRCGRGEWCRPPRACVYCHAHTFCMNCTVSVVWLVHVHVRRNRVVGRLWATTSRGSVYYSCRFAGVVSAELLYNVHSGLQGISLCQPTQVEHPLLRIARSRISLRFSLFGFLRVNTSVVKFVSRFDVLRNRRVELFEQKVVFYFSCHIDRGKQWKMNYVLVLAACGVVQNRLI